MISEASEVETDFRTILLPGLLEHQQSIQEEFVIVWYILFAKMHQIDDLLNRFFNCTICRKSILQETSQYSDLTSSSFQDIQRRIESSIQSIHPAEEYREFTERHKYEFLFKFFYFSFIRTILITCIGPQNRASPPAPIVFQFDQTLIEDKDTLGKLQPNTLTVDNLTVDWLRNRLVELETSVKDCQDKQAKVQLDYGTTAAISIQSTLTNGIGRKENNKCVFYCKIHNWFVSN